MSQDSFYLLETNQLDVYRDDSVQTDQPLDESIIVFLKAHINEVRLLLFSSTGIVELEYKYEAKMTSHPTVPNRSGHAILFGRYADMWDLRCFL